MGWMDMLLGGLGGAATAGVDYEPAKRKRQREDEDVRLQRERQARMDALAERQFGLQQQNADEDRASRVAQFVTPDLDLTGMPDVAATLEKGGIPLVRTPGVGPRKLADSLTLPSMPSSDLRLPGSAPMASMPDAKYDPTGTEGAGPAPLPMGGPIKVNLPTYDIGTPGKVTRAKTSQEALADKGRTNQISMLRGLLDTPNLKDPAVRTLIEGEIANLESGGQSNMTAASVMSALRLGEPEAPRVDKDVIEPKDRAAIAAALNTQDVPERWSALTPQQKRAWDAYEKSQRGTEPRPSGSGGMTDLQIYDRTVRAGNDFERFTRDATVARQQAGVARTGYEELKRNMKGGTAQGPATVAYIMSFQKLLDPGSVVRESEYNRSTEMQGMIDRFDALKHSVLAGGRISENTAQEMLNITNAVVKSYESAQRDYARRTRQQVQTLGGDLRNALTPSVIDMMDQFDAEEELAGKPEKTGTVVNGKRFAVVNGEVRRIN